MSFKYFLVNTLKEVSQTILISLGIFFIVYLFLVQPHRVKGESMAPNFSDGELLLTEKVSYRFSSPSRGDVVVFKAPGPRKVDFIKRIVALPGENVKIKDGSIFINGLSLPEPYEVQKTQTDINLLLEPNQYFVLGDNRASSSDSRAFGPIEKRSIIGRAWLVYFPVFDSEKSKGARIISKVDYAVPN